MTDEGYKRIQSLQVDSEEAAVPLPSSVAGEEGKRKVLHDFHPLEEVTLKGLKG